MQDVKLTATGAPRDVKPVNSLITKIPFNKGQYYWVILNLIYLLDSVTHHWTFVNVGKVTLKGMSNMDWCQNKTQHNMNSL